jgi:hypothetical protein
MIHMPAGRGDGYCQKITRNGIYRMPDFQFGIRKQNIRGSIEYSIGGIEPGAAWVLRTGGCVPMVVIANLRADSGWMFVRHGLATGPEGQHQ